MDVRKDTYRMHFLGDSRPKNSLSPGRGTPYAEKSRAAQVPLLLSPLGLCSSLETARSMGMSANCHKAKPAIFGFVKIER